ncbi:competence type IV pilus minor pilin ComGF [Edaphobacillus lindanitolerans]|uniref:Competence protein ComGF n=1 Tax=Edaphobacillus lindanitolerans TaxID=550447 RepID=A0A1U7PPG5_9BACI|nr:competence type IV pilus minor pilin ComGF [Edaphobacillus lindanitolerans]SIT81943.1 competence protein ComGF [Edaphobacillus lindanitolerans]
MCPINHCPAGRRSASGPNSREGGYTFIDALLQLTVFAAFCMFSLAFLTWAAQTAGRMTDDSAVEWELFRRELSAYLQNADGVDILGLGEGVSVRRGGSVTDIERYGQLIRKRVDNRGHEQMLLNVERISFSLDGHLLVLEVMFLNGRERRTAHTITYEDPGQ